MSAATCPFTPADLDAIALALMHRLAEMERYRKEDRSNPEFWTPLIDAAKAATEAVQKVRLA